MKKRLFVLTCVLGISMVTACGATEAVENEATTESQVVEASVEESTEVSEEATEESTEASTEEVVESSQEIVASSQEVEESTQEPIAEGSQESTEASSETTESEGEGTEYTWRQTTEARNLYFMEGDEELIGKMHLGETFDEILQMAEDPTCDFDEENFFNDTVFEGITVEQVQYLVDNGYDLDSLVHRIVQEGKRNVLELDIWQ